MPTNVVQADRPTVLVSMRFIQGSFTFIGLAAIPPADQPHPASSSVATTASISQHARLPEKLQAVLREMDVHLPQDVSKTNAASAQYFSIAQQHRVSAGFWTKNIHLPRVLQLLMQSSKCTSSSLQKSFDTCCILLYASKSYLLLPFSL